MASSHPAPHWSRDSLGSHLANRWRLLASCCFLRDLCHVMGAGDSTRICRFWGQFRLLGMAGSHLAAPPPPHIWNSVFLPLSPYLNDICPIFLLLFLPLHADLLFDVNAAIVGWLLLAVHL
jgi:hypothetical protein